MLVNVQRIKSLGRESKSGSLGVIRISGQCILVSLDPVDRRADEYSLLVSIGCGKKAVFLFYTSLRTTWCKRDIVILLNRLLGREKRQIQVRFKNMVIRKTWSSYATGTDSRGFEISEK